MLQHCTENLENTLCSPVGTTRQNDASWATWRTADCWLTLQSAWSKHTVECKQDKYMIRSLKHRSTKAMCTYVRFGRKGCHQHGILVPSILFVESSRCFPRHAHFVPKHAETFAGWFEPSWKEDFRHGEVSHQTVLSGGTRLHTLLLATCAVMRRSSN